MRLTLRPLEDHSTAAWDAFVTAHKYGTFFHRAAWQHVIQRAFGHQPYYILAEQDGTVAGVLPLVHMKTTLFSNNTLTSLPFCVYGGPLAADSDTLAALSAQAVQLMAQLRAKAVEFRYRDAIESDWIERPGLYVTFRKPITASDETNMKAIPRKQRAMVRKGIQNSLTSVVSQQAQTLHRVYAESVHNLGTPVFARSYFQLLLDAFHDCSDVVTILDDSRPIASVLNFYFRDEVLPYYGGGTREARERAGNDFMYWEVMRRAASRGYRLFDFGRSKLGTGAYAFKQNWGFEPAPLRYRYHLASDAGIPDHNPLSPKYRLLVAAWKKLPLAVANALGPHIVRGLG